MENRCGSGIIQFVKEGDLLVGKRNLVLGLNIPNYPRYFVALCRREAVCSLKDCAQRRYSSAVYF
ncbi:hypothetical protein [Persicitalea sp.]|uniref:hypothetical protein n=1 Tax=Persicitalea sp. TaxID=3100273 RepID=UPI003592FBB2